MLSLNVFSCFFLSDTRIYYHLANPPEINLYVEILQVFSTYMHICIYTHIYMCGVCVSITGMFPYTLHVE